MNIDLFYLWFVLITIYLLNFALSVQRELKLIDAGVNSIILIKYMKSALKLFIIIDFINNNITKFRLCAKFWKTKISPILHFGCKNLTLIEAGINSSDCKNFCCTRWSSSLEHYAILIVIVIPTHHGNPNWVLLSSSLLSLLQTRNTSYLCWQSLWIHCIYV